MAAPDAGPWRPHWSAYGAECLGTALLVFAGLSVVIFDFGPGSPVVHLLPDPLLRRFLTGLLFGGIGALLALSPLGRISGAHLDPVLSFGFWLAGSLGPADTALYVAAQGVGAVGGALALPPLWGGFGAAVSFGMSLPSAGWLLALAGEIIATFCLVGGILFFVGHRSLRAFTPALIPPLVSVLVGLEAPWSGTSMNPARSLGPALVSHSTGVMWIYVLGPLVGAVAAAVLCTRLDRVHVAKVAHQAHDPHGRFHGDAAHSPVAAIKAAGARHMAR